MVFLIRVLVVEVGERYVVRGMVFVRWLLRWRRRERS